VVDERGARVNAADLGLRATDSAAPVDTSVPAVPVVTGFAAWVQTVARPIGPNGVGEDPRYGERFGLIKAEIDRLTGTNFSQVVQQARALLSEEAKDLRVASYLVLGTLYEEGLRGLPDALEAYRLIVERYWERCFPVKDAARAQAVAWLNNERMEGFMQLQKSDGADTAELQRLQQAITGFNAAIHQRLGGEGPQWTMLSQWVDRALSHRLAEQAQLEQEQRSQDERLQQKGSTDAPLAEGIIESHITRICSHYRATDERPRAVGLLRAWRWGSLKTPPNENGQTRIPPVRDAVLTEIAAARAGGTPLHLFELCEGLFMEPGAQWSFDLQQAAHGALVGLNDPVSARVLEQAVRALLERCPGIIEFKYDGGQPFAGADTREWLESLSRSQDARGGSGGGAPTVVDQIVQEVARRAAEASTQDNKQDLSAGLMVLRELPVETARQRFIKRLEEARLCVRTKHAEMALPILEALEQEIEAKDLAQWEPELAVSVWRLMVQAIAQDLHRADASRQEELNARLRKITASVCRTDLAEAARLYRPVQDKGVNTHG
jgi:type VI secretion system protein VasJ